MNKYFLSKLAKLNIDVLSQLALVLPPEYLFPVVHPTLLTVCGGFERLLSPLSFYRWRIVNHHTTVRYVDDGFGKRRVWCLNGTPHRENDKPAKVWESGTKEWWFHGEMHREDDKPAYTGVNGYKAWWINGKEHREGDKPAYFKFDGFKAWYKHGERHREHNKPAKVWKSGTKEWWMNGKHIKTKRIE